MVHGKLSIALGRTSVHQLLVKRRCHLTRRLANVVTAVKVDRHNACFSGCEQCECVPCDLVASCVDFECKARLNAVHVVFACQAT